MTLTPAQLQQQFDSSVSNGDSASTVLQSGVMMSEALTKVDCSGAPSCSSLNRHSCSTIENTCGECVENYIGVAGDANMACVAETNLSVPVYFIVFFFVCI